MPELDVLDSSLTRINSISTIYHRATGDTSCRSLACRVLENVDGVPIEASGECTEARLASSKPSKPSRRYWQDEFNFLNSSLILSLLIMLLSVSVLRYSTKISLARSFLEPSYQFRIRQCYEQRHISRTARRMIQPADDPSFTSIVDNPPRLVRAGKGHGLGLVILGNINVHRVETQ